MLQKQLELFRKMTLTMLATALIASPLAAQSWEYETGEGFHSEDWWDPTDWFDDEPEWQYTDYDYETDFENDQTGDWAFWNEEFWEDSFDYDYKGYANYDFGTHYEWNDQTNSWERDYGPYRTAYDYDPASYAIIYSSVDTNRNRQNQNPSDRANQFNSQKRGDRNTQVGEVKQKTLRGTIDGFRHMELGPQGSDRSTFTVAKVKLQDGKNVVVNLGEKQRLNQLDLQTGDRVTMLGALGKIDGEPVYVANKLRYNGRTLDVNRAFTQLNERKMRQYRQGNRNQRFSNDREARSQNQGVATRYRSQGNRSQSQRMTLDGTLEGFRNVTFDTRSGDNLVGKLRLENGRAVIVDFGSEYDLADLDLESGDSVRISGQTKRIDGKKILKANTVRINGRQPEQYSYNY